MSFAELIFGPNLDKKLPCDHCDDQKKRGMQMVGLPFLRSSLKSIFTTKSSRTIQSTRASKGTQPSPQGHSHSPMSAPLDFPMSDQDLLKQAFQTSVSRRRMDARSWLSKRDIDLHGLKR